MTKLSELGTAFLEQATVQTCMAYYYQNPNGQYDLCKEITADHYRFSTEFVPPEWMGPDAYYYGVCRSFLNDVLTQIFGEDLFHGGVHGTFFQYLIKPLSIGRLNMVYMYYREDGERIAGSNGSQYFDKELFVEDFKKKARPGDIVYIVKPGDSGHVIFFLGDLYGDGETYIMHCWPVDGGPLNMETGVNRWEPNGAITLQTAADFLYVGARPKYTFAACERIFLMRPSLEIGKLGSHEVTESSIFRVENPFMDYRKTFSKYMYETVVAGDELTVTECIRSARKAEFKDLVLTEYVPEGTVLTAASVKASGKWKAESDGNVLTFTGTVPAGQTVQISYTVRVSENVKPGQKLVFRSGTLERNGHALPTRALTYLVGTSRLSEKETEKLSAFGTEEGKKASEYGETALSSVNAFYEKNVGFSPAFPARTEELLKALYEVREDEEAECPMLFAKAPATETEDRLRRMLIRRGEGGRYVKLADNLEDRLLDYREEYLLPGDVVVTLTGENTVEAKDAERVHAFVVLGNGRVISFGDDGTAEEKAFPETVGNAVLNNVNLFFRPAAVR